MPPCVTYDLFFLFLDDEFRVPTDRRSAFAAPGRTEAVRVCIAMFDERSHMSFSDVGIW